MNFPTGLATDLTLGEHAVPGAAGVAYAGARRRRRRFGRTVTGALAALAASATALAHHGFGRFDRSQEVEFTGVITGMDFVNPHAYLHFNAATADGGTIAMRCEMRAATLLRRSGWTEEMFVVGASATVYGFGHRDDPASCYLEDITIGDAPGFNRNDQFEHTSSVDVSDRPMRSPSGELNISGDWAQEQYVIAVPPGGSGGGLVPKSMIAAIESGELTMADVPSSGWGPRPVTFTARGQAEADAFVMWSPEDNPRLRCEPTSIIFDWVFDGAVNRITQEADRIVVNYGLYSFERVIHMNTDEHPADIVPSYAGHSIGRWEGDVLVVDTIGFEPGVIAPPVRHSDQFHIVERFSLDTQTMELKRDFVAEDPVYFSDQYLGSDTLLPADVPYVAHPCDELAYEFIPEEERGD
ncbi:DUF6152 family protein [Candidatus Rariloculus sp.]|uniref:DUF6152 family protein n=1 Tax=Candidatus Rariloculus sp. TaxID=3101265 RepID=UPI003D0E7229